MPAPRRAPTVTELQAIIQSLESDKARMAERIAQLEHLYSPAPMVLLKLAARNIGIRPERLRRACEAGKVVGEQLGNKRNGRWVVDEQSAADYVRQMR